MTPPGEIAVTGLGAVTGWGSGVEALWRGLRGGSTAFGALTRFDTGRHRTRLAAEAPAPPRARRGRAVRETISDAHALAAAREALADAVLPAPLAGRTLGVFFGSSTGGFWESELYYEALVRERRGARVGMLVSQQYNAPADAVARAAGATGPVVTISSACTSGALAIAAAFDALRSGEVDVALAGGADSLCQLTYAGFNSLRAVDPGPCRPFREGRAGLSLGEGAAVLVLERRADAEERGARIRALLCGTGSTCDASHMTAPAPDGAGAARAIRMALEEAGVAAGEIAFVNLHGTGTPHNDAAEWSALAAVFGADAARELPATSTKGSIGHLLGSAGAVEAVATVRCLEEREVHPTPGEGPVDPACPVALVLGAPRSIAPGGAALSTNLAFGGSNAALVFRPAPEGAA